MTLVDAVFFNADAHKLETLIAPSGGIGETDDNDGNAAPGTYDGDVYRTQPRCVAAVLINLSFELWHPGTNQAIKSSEASPLSAPFGASETEAHFRCILRKFANTPGRGDNPSVFSAGTIKITHRFQRTATPHQTFRGVCVCW